MASDATPRPMTPQDITRIRCPVGQAEQLFAMLKKLRKDVLFVRFPDETHERSRWGKPPHRLARFAFILDWFAKRLGTPAATGAAPPPTALT
jgi:hypothetical protein